VILSEVNLPPSVADSKSLIFAAVKRKPPDCEPLGLNGEEAHLTAINFNT
jgi:hypothetical protein